MDNKKIIAISFLIIALSIGYYFVIFLPNKERGELKLDQLRYDSEQKQIREQKAKEQDKENARDECLVQAHNAYEKEGAQECIKRGYTENDYKNLKCYLPDSVLQDLLKRQSDWQKTCLETYK